MTFLKTMFVSVAFGCLGAATLSVAKSDDATKKIVDEVLDRAGFVAQLPKHPVVGVDAKTPKKQVELLRHALVKLGKIPGVEFMALPPGASAPKTIRSFTPTYPYEMRRDGVSGGAIFLVLVNPAGKAQSVYCTAFTDKAFATAGAEAIAGWTFEPAKVDNKPLPSILAIPLQFTPDSDQSPFG